MGMAPAFSPQADFSDLSPKAGPIRFVQHAATLRVDEDGTEGAAATAVGNEAMAAPAPTGIPVKFDHPYLLVVRDAKAGEPLFIARVTDPSEAR
jgi:serpin B